MYCGYMRVPLQADLCKLLWFCRTIGTDPYGDPNCVHISSITTHTNQTYMVIVSDEDNFDAVLPVQTVKYISVSHRQPTLLSQRCHAVGTFTVPTTRVLSLIETGLEIEPRHVCIRCG